MNSKNKIISFIFLFFSSFYCSSIDFNTQVFKFNNEKKESYIEVFYMISGKSVNYIQKQEFLEASVSTTLSIFSLDSNLIFADKYNLVAPNCKDSTEIKDFIDVQRIPIKEGNYFLVLELSDNNNVENNSRKKINFSIKSMNKIVEINTIQLIESSSKTISTNKFSKSGFDIIPIIGNYYFPPYRKEIKFYSEIHTDIINNEDLLLMYYIESNGKRVPLNKYSSFKKEKAKKIIPLLSSFNIENLPSGNYNLTIEVKNRSLEILDKKSIFFQRNNPISDISLEDIYSIDVSNTFTSKFSDLNVLKQYINALYPISTRSERRYQENQLNLQNLEFMQQYFYSFWKNRDYLAPEQAWNEYLEKINYVNEKFGTLIQKGFETDRGRVYLEYGEANTIDSRINDPNDFPYEIWQYYNLKNQNNKIFVFIMENASTNNYSLVHSTATGEIYNEKWIYLVNRVRNQSNFDITGDGILPNNNNFGEHINSNTIINEGNRSIPY